MSRSTSVLLALTLVPLMLVLATGCGPSGSSQNSGDPSGLRAPLIDFPRQIRFAQPILVVPGTRWDRFPEADGLWRFRTFSRIHCVVQEPVEAPLRIGFRPDAETAKFSFEASWDEQPLDLSEAQHEPGVWWLEIAPERLTPGRHELMVRRVHRPQDRPAARPGQPRPPVQHNNRFLDLRYHHGAEETILEPAAAPDQRLIAEYLTHGVIGRAQERRDGLLFVGVDRHQLELPETTAGAPVRAHFEPENLSEQPARFRVTAGERQAETQVEPGARGQLTVELDAGDRELALEVEGDAEGLYLWGLPLLETAASGRGGAAREELSPVILITLDTTRRDALGPYNGRDDLTPVLSELAGHSTVFEQAFSTAPWTLPSHASIFTGLYPSKHGAGVSKTQLPAGTETLAVLMRQRGYLTAGFSAGELSSSRFGLAQGFSHYRNPDQFETEGSRVASYVEDFLDAYSAFPLFLFINFFDPHAVYQAPAEYDERLGVAERAEKIRHLPVWGDLLGGEMSSWRLAVEGKAPINPEVQEYLKSAYLAEVAYTDHLVGRLFDRLRQLGLFDQALIIVTADHGELLGEYGHVSHAARLDPELVEIPLIVKWPGQSEGERVRDLTSLVDLFPTVLQAVGIEPPPSDGRSLDADSRASTERRDRRPFVLLEEHEYLVHPLPKNMKISPHLFGVQRPEFRQLVWHDGTECAQQRQGVWQEAPCTTPGERLLQSLETVLQRGSTPAPGAAPEADGAMSEELKQSLEALGYL